MQELSKILDLREQDYGAFEVNATIAQQLKKAFGRHGCLTEVEQEAAEMILTKLSRLSAGGTLDTWLDITGYAMLAYKYAAEHGRP